jgi:GNAT superfamily N-acetyltransferase
MQLRDARAGDEAAIADIWYRGWRDGHLGYVPDELSAHRHPVDFAERVPARLAQTTVATVASRVVGFVTVHEDEIEQMYVDESARGTGVADALLRHGEHVIADQFDVAWLAVVAGNTRARRFYGRNGWRDASAIDYAAEVAGDTVPVPCRRYEKAVA